MVIRRRLDVFICHATEDKEEIARPLAKILIKRGLKVWYDEYSLRLGDSQRRNIDEGLLKSKYAVVILSHNFFRKEWPQKEYDMLVQHEMSLKRKVILPVWHKITRDEVAKYSLGMADKVAVSTNDGPEYVANKIIEEIGKKYQAKAQDSIKKIVGSVKNKKSIQPELVDTRFKRLFSKHLNLIIKQLENGKESNFEDLIDKILMLFKGRIEKWDAPSVKYATKELFMQLYKYGEEDGLADMYTFFADLFAYAHSQRRHLLGVMVNEFSTIMLRAWLDNYDVERGEKAAKILLKLAIDYVKKDFDVTEACAGIIDDLSEDMFEPEILSKEILLAAYLTSHKNSKTQKLLSDLLRWIRINVQDSDSTYYLRNALARAETEQDDYALDLSSFKKQVLTPLMEQIIDDDVQTYADLLINLEEGERVDDFYISYKAELLEEIILGHEPIRPNVANEIKQKIFELQNPEANKIFDRIVDNSKILTKIYKGSDMITTFHEFLQFLQTNAARSERDIGLTTYSPLMIDFETKLTKIQRDALKEMGRKYDKDRQVDFDVYDQQLILEPDSFVFENRKYDVNKLTGFLAEVNNVSRISSIAQGICFTVRQTNN